MYLWAFVGTIGLCGLAAAAEPYPVKPIRMIVAVPPGGPTDTLARLVAPRLTEAFGQTVVIDNRPGANGIIAYEMTARAAPDGYTFTAVAAGVVINPSLYRNVNYDPLKDFAPLTLGITVPNILVVHPSVPAASVKELVPLARAKPGAVTFASAGNGTSGHLALGITSAKRSPVAPELPTVAEQGLPGFEVIGWFGWLAPAATPKAIVNRLHGELVRALKRPDVRERLSSQSTEPVGNSPQEFAAFMKSEHTKWARLIKAANIKVE